VNIHPQALSHDTATIVQVMSWYGYELQGNGSTRLLMRKGHALGQKNALQCLRWLHRAERKIMAVRRAAEIRSLTELLTDALEFAPTVRRVAGEFIVVAGPCIIAEEPDELTALNEALATVAGWEAGEQSNG